MFLSSRASLTIHVHGQEFEASRLMSHLPFYEGSPFIQLPMSIKSTSGPVGLTRMELAHMFFHVYWPV